MRRRDVMSRLFHLVFRFAEVFFADAFLFAFGLEPRRLGGRVGGASGAAPPPS